MSRSRLHITAVLASCAVLLFAGIAAAHVSISAPSAAVAGQNQVLTFTVGHGCEGADTIGIEVSIPAAVTSLRALPSAWGEATLTKDAAGLVTAVSWSKTQSRPEDDHYYAFQIRMRTPEAPFTTLYMSVKQTCLAADGTESTVDWAALPDEVAAAPMGEEPPEAAALRIMPARFPGWNKYTVPAAIDDLSIFDDAVIVWAGDAAYSSNPDTMELIESEDGVEVLTEIAADSEIWVKY
jgi:uncharacterized protein YcnI